jgi:hypothetical protein
MNWKLIFLMSLFGLVMAFATISFIPVKVEPACWLVIFIFCAVFIAKYCTGRYFLHGVYIGLANCVWIMVVHAVFFHAYMDSHPMMKIQMRSFEHPLWIMTLTGPVIGLVSGLVLGLFAIIAVKLLRKNNAG